MIIYNILTELSSTKSVKEKESILRKYKDNLTLQSVIYQALSPRVKFYIKKVPYVQCTGVLSLHEAIRLLHDISSRKLTGSAAIEFLTQLLVKLNPEDAEVLSRIIEKDLKCGINTATVNKVWPGLIEETPYMGAITFNKKKAEKLFASGELIYSQVKMDGRYVNVIVDENGVPTLESRSGENTLINTFQNTFPKTPNGFVLNGELTIDGMPRYESNGIIASLISINKNRDQGKDVSKKEQKFREEWGMSCSDAESSIRLTTWDIISIEEYANGFSEVPYSERLRKLSDTVLLITLHNLAVFVRLIETKVVYSLEEAMEHWRELVARGEEGTIIKDPNCQWKDGKPNGQMKIKLAFDVDLRIVSFKPGTPGTRLQNTLGALICESQDGLVQTDPSGMTDEMRDLIWRNKAKYLNTIVEVTCSGLSITDNGVSLLHPRVSELRTDKLHANTYEEIQSIQSSIQEIQ